MTSFERKFWIRIIPQCVALIGVVAWAIMAQNVYAIATFVIVAFALGISRVMN